MTPFLNNFVKTIILSMTFLTIESYASELYVEAETLPFTLPSDLALWQDATNSYMEAVLSTQALKDQWQILLDLTMPKHGNFDPTNPTRRATTIVQAFNKMLDLDDVNRVTYLNSLLNRHKIYVPQTDELFKASEVIQSLEETSTIRVIEGCVEHGQELGRQLGFPTANISFESPNLPEGLYRAHTSVGEQSFLSFAYYSLHNFYNKPLVEVHLFDYSGDLYGQSITANLTHFIRPPIPFISNQQMSNRIERDVELIRGIVGVSSGENSL